MKTLSQIIGAQSVTIPSFTQRRIYWHKNSGSAFVLVGYCPDTLDYFLAMFEHARETFPELKLGEISCGKVKKSNSIQGFQGFTLIRFNVKMPRKEYAGWDDCDGKNLDFNW